MTGTIPGHEAAAFGGVLVAGVVFVYLFFYLCVKVGIKPTFRFFTAGFWPRKWHRRQTEHAETENEHADERSPRP